MDQFFVWVPVVGGIIALGAGIWYYAAIGKAVHEEEQAAGKDLTYEMNPFTGSAKSKSVKKK
ncbi:hypothetical protein ACSVDE_03075 [Pseudalkalibacillus sp. Hm43]|uniref:hypothetical protein n=1 Tax=Pseudalkalibacillus sp. Hm43 TaxID=3450742 RepID=UPI003F41CDE7